MIMSKQIRNLLCRFRTFLLFNNAGRYIFAVDAAVNLVDGVGEAEFVYQFLLGGGDAAGILAADDAADTLGKGQVFPLCQLAVLNDVDGDAGIDIGQNVEVQVDDLGHLDDVLAAHLFAFRILNHGNGAVQIVQLQDLIDLHAAACGDVV